MLFDVAAELGVGPGSRVLDVGCRDGRHVFELARRFGCLTTGVDPVQANLQQGEAALDKIKVEEPKVARLVQLLRGRIESLPFVDTAFDLVWARDMLIHVEDLAAGLRESKRVLAPHGHVLIFQMFATPWLGPAEAQRLWSSLAAVPRNPDPEYFESSVAQAGFTIASRQDIGSEWREFGEDHGDHRTSRQLLRAARLIRGREALVAKLGRADYEAELANSLWGVYQMIGKLSGRIYVLV